jgi:hypothetical protein
MGTYYEDTDEIYYFKWTVNGGHVSFGYHGTQAMFDAKMLLDKHENGPSKINIIQKTFCCTGKEQKEFEKEQKANVQKV